MKMSGNKYPFETILLAAVVDKLALLVWSKTKEAEHGLNRPKSIAEKLINDEKNIKTFNTAEEFEKKRNELIREGGVQTSWN